MATVRPGVFSRLEKDEARSAAIENVNVDLKEEDIRTKVVEVVKTAMTLLISTADFVVAGGRGVGKAEGFELLKDLANVLGGMLLVLELL